jgi:hypothetical protein
MEGLAVPGLLTECAQNPSESLAVIGDSAQWTHNVIEHGIEWSGINTSVRIS